MGYRLLNRSYGNFALPPTSIHTRPTRFGPVVFLFSSMLHYSQDELYET
jgi:hypothetical protein